MKKLYIMLTYTGTSISKIIRIYTKKEYSHASISLDERLTKMYSFGRYNPYITFWGGFIKEEQNQRTYKRFKNTKCIIYSLEVTDEQYEKAENEINKFIKNAKKHRFNIIGLVAVSLNIRVKRKNKMYCSEFVKHILDTAEIQNELPEIVAPYHLQELENLEVVYEGLLREY